MSDDFQTKIKTILKNIQKVIYTIVARYNSIRIHLEMYASLSNEKFLFFNLFKSIPMLNNKIKNNCVVYPYGFFFFYDYTRGIIPIGCIDK